MRGDTNFQREVQSVKLSSVYLVSMELRCTTGNSDNEQACIAAGGEWTPPVHVTNFDRAITHLNNEFLPIGGFLGIDTITDTTGFEIGSVTLSLSGVDRGFISLVLSRSYIDKPVFVYRAVLGDGGGVISAVEIYRGYIDEPIIQDDEDELRVSVTVRHHFADFDKRAGRHTNNADHQFHFPGDTSMSHADEGLIELPWGRATS